MKKIGAYVVGIGICWMGFFPLHAEEAFPEWLRDLDSPSFYQREAAWERLNLEVQIPKNRANMATEAARYLETETPTFEVFSRLKELFPETLSQLQETSGALSIEKLLDENYAVRQMAERQIGALAQDSQQTFSLLKQLRDRLSDPFLTLDDQTRLCRLEKEVRGIWLKQGAHGVEMSATNAEEAVRFLTKIAWNDSVTSSFIELENQLTRPYLIEPGQNPLGDMNALVGSTPQEKRLAYRGWRTSRELEDALACEETRATVEKVLAEKFLGATLSGQKILFRLRLLSRPCVVSEYWQNGVHQTSQFLEIGRRQQISPNDRWTAFSQLTDVNVHCDNGYNLSPGFHPLDVAIPHPRQDALFCIRGLTTPRQKLLYPFQMIEASEKRWATLTRKTLDGLNDFAKFDDVTLKKLFFQLEPRTVSAWIPQNLASFTQPGEIQLLIEMLLTLGTKEAIPVLLEKLEKDTLPPYGDVRWNWGYAAALSIARRDPWDGVETWLKTLLDDDTPLFSLPKESPMEETPMEISSPGQRFPAPSSVKAPTVGATAASILCLRHDVSPQSMGLVRYENHEIRFLTWYSYANVAAKKAVLEKWPVTKE